jgi:hypothetical protein
MPMPKGFKHSEETKLKISQAQLREKNHRYGQHCSEEHKEKVRLANTGNNYRWKGDDIGYKGLHKWIREHFLPPNSCQSCGMNRNLDLANTTGVYNRDFKNWKYLCRSCHWRLDGIINNLKGYVGKVL